MMMMMEEDEVMMIPFPRPESSKTVKLELSSGMSAPDFKSAAMNSVAHATQSKKGAVARTQKRKSESIEVSIDESVKSEKGDSQSGSRKKIKLDTVASDLIERESAGGGSEANQANQANQKTESRKSRTTAPKESLKESPKESLSPKESRKETKPSRLYPTCTTFRESWDWVLGTCENQRSIDLYAEMQPLYFPRAKPTMPKTHVQFSYKIHEKWEMVQKSIEKHPSHAAWIQAVNRVVQEQKESSSNRAKKAAESATVTKKGRTGSEKLVELLINFYNSEKGQGLSIPVRYWSEDCDKYPVPKNPKRTHIQLIHLYKPAPITDTCQPEKMVQNNTRMVANVQFDNELKLVTSNHSIQTFECVNGFTSFKCYPGLHKMRYERSADDFSSLFHLSTKDHSLGDYIGFRFDLFTPFWNQRLDGELLKELIFWYVWCCFELIFVG